MTDPTPDAQDAVLERLEARCRALEQRNARLEAEREADASQGATSIAAEQRYRAIFDAEPACVKLVDVEGRILSMNPAGLKMVDADREAEVLGRRMHDFVVAEDHAAVDALSARVFRGETTSLEFEIVGLRGTRREMETFAAPLRDDHGRIFAQLAVSHDITLRKQEQLELSAYRERLEALVSARTAALEASREEARRVERLAALGTLSVGLAHELNNPLGSILLGASLLAETIDDTAPGDSGSEPDRKSIDLAIAGIRRDVDRCRHIIEGLLRFGRGESSEKKPISLNPIVCRSREHARPVTEKREVVLDLDPDLPKLMGNATELGQVLINLLENAARASQVGDSIRVVTTVRNDEILCVVEDPGRGMSEDVQCRACEPFFTTGQDSGGTGLGLSVSHGIMLDHSGRLEIESRLGIGTSVSLSFPIHAAPITSSG